MGKNLNKSSIASYNTKLKDGRAVKSKAVIPAKFNPKSLTELSANKLEQMIKPKSAKPKSLVQMEAEKIEQSIKQPAKLPKPSKLLPTLKSLASQALFSDKINYWENKANENASIISLDKGPLIVLI